MSAVLAWECVSVIGGGSYWLHYLISLVPGLVVAAAVTATVVHGVSPAASGPSRLARSVGSPFAALAYIAAVAGFALTSSVAGASQGSAQDPTSTWLAAHAAADDTALVAYGQPNILRDAGLDSPYPYLWSLIVRVKDPDLSLLTTTLARGDGPDWLVTGTGGLHGWGIEAENIARLLDRLHDVAPRVDVLVVDDRSPDGTAQIVTEISRSRDCVFLLDGGSKQGLGAAYRAGFTWALDSGYEVTVQMDADFSHPPEKVVELISSLQHADIAIGSRYVPGGSLHNWSRGRRFISWAGNQYVRLVLGSRSTTPLPGSGPSIVRR